MRRELGCVLTIALIAATVAACGKKNNGAGVSLKVSFSRVMTPP